MFKTIPTFLVMLTVVLATTFVQAQSCPLASRPPIPTTGLGLPPQQIIQSAPSNPAALAAQRQALVQQHQQQMQMLQQQTQQNQQALQQQMQQQAQQHAQQMQSLQQQFQQQMQSLR
jgi:hypothetical protein